MRFLFFQYCSACLWHRMLSALVIVTSNLEKKKCNLLLDMPVVYVNFILLSDDTVEYTTVLTDYLPSGSIFNRGIL